MEIGGPVAPSEAADRRRPAGDAVQLRRLSRLSAEDGDRATERGRAAAEGQGGKYEQSHSFFSGPFHEVSPSEAAGSDEAATVPVWHGAVRRSVVISVEIGDQASFRTRRDSATRVVSTRGESLGAGRSEEHTSELQSLMRISYAVFCLKQI